MRERLIDLIGTFCKKENVLLFNRKVLDKFANYLFADGWIRPPCKVGQILFIIEAGLIYEAKVKEYKYCSNSTNGIHWHIIFEELFVVSEAHIGKTIFYTREEAEAALRKEDKGK